ncbi:hypothetical protein TNCV_3108741 [Trichonephila clavipes]|uniref:Uncharacterized protein n=1 Tax=Trichonephila clavipes TaxID=2585209 RepID=A0A8X6S7Q7_TRICX|nr:hypothetical protein TNCV_3108741 [Trichonephila clavipes]
MTGQIYRNAFLEPRVSGRQGCRVCVYGWQRPSSLCKHHKRMTSIAGCHPYGLDSIFPGLDSSRVCVRHTWQMSCNPLISSYMSTVAPEPRVGLGLLKKPLPGQPSCC